MSTKNFYVKNGLRVSGNTLLNGSSYNDTPLTKLHVKSASNTAGSDLTNVQGIIVENSGSSNTNFILKLATNAGNILSITNSGRVGIGTTSISYKLEVDDYILSKFNTSGGGLYLGNSSHGLTRTQGTNEVNLYTSSGTLFLGASGINSKQLNIFQNGNIGIGTTSIINPQSWGKILQVYNFASNGAGISLSDSNNEYNIATYAGNLYISDGVDERITITSTGNIGIGTSDPVGYKLNINGSLRTASDVTIAGNIAGVQSITSTGTVTLSGVAAGTDNTVLLLNSSNQVIQDEIDSRVWGSSLVDGTGTANYLSKWSDGNTITNSQIFDNGTNVGIGTSNPGYKLDVVTSTAGYVAVFRSTNAGDNHGLYIRVNNDASNSLLDNHVDITSSGTNGGSLALSTGNSEVIRITTTSRVGIKNTSPTYDLDVTGNGRFTGSLLLGQYLYHDGDTDTYLDFYQADGFRIVTGGVERIRVNNTETVFNEGSNNYNFRVESDNESFMIYVNSGSDSIGIGTAGSNRNRISIESHNPTISVNGTNYYKATYSSIIGGYNIASGVTDSGYRIALDASSYVNNINFAGTLAAQYAIWARHGAYISTSGSTITSSIGVYIDSLTNAETTITNLYGLYQASGSAKNYFGGTVGIGITAPSYKLDVIGDIRATTNMYLGQYLYHVNDTNTYLDFYQADGFRIVTGGQENIRFNTTETVINNDGVVLDFRVESDTDTYCLFVDSSADNIGLGTSQPNEKLTVVGNISATGTVYGDASEFGAIMEAGLKTKNTSKQPEGTVLIWKNGKLKPCTKELDKNVSGISTNKSDSPIVLGAEPVLVTGKVKEGDFIVTSNKRGHGRAVNINKYSYNQLLGTIIAQSLENGDGDSYLIKAMIRKL